MTKLSGTHSVAADAAWGTVIGTFDQDIKQLQSNPFGYFGIADKRSLRTAWNGQAIPGSYDIVIHTTGTPQTFKLTITPAASMPAPPPPPAPSPPPPPPAPPPPPTSHVVLIGMAEDAYQGDAQYSIAVDGVLKATGTITTLQSSGKSQEISLNVPDGTHKIAVSFTNDAWDGTPQTDRNLYVNYVKYDGAPVWSATKALVAQGDTLTVMVPPPPVQPTAVRLTPVQLSIPDNARAGVVIATIAVDMSDGSAFKGSITSSDSGLFAVSGMNVVTARALTAADDGSHSTTITAHQANGAAVSARFTI